MDGICFSYFSVPMKRHYNWDNLWKKALHLWITYSFRESVHDHTSRKQDNGAVAEGLHRSTSKKERGPGMGFWNLKSNPQELTSSNISTNVERNSQG